MRHAVARLRAIAALLVVPVVLLGGCAEDIVVDSEEVARAGLRPATSYASDDVVLRVEPVLRDGWISGQHPPHRWLPVLIVYGNGRVISHEPSDDALPRFFERAIGEDAARGIAQHAIDAGVGWRSQRAPMDGYESTRFTVLTDHGTRESVLNQHFEMGTRRDDRWMEELLAQLMDLPAMLDGFNVGDPKPYNARAYLIVYRPWADWDSARGPERAWPGPAFPVAHGLSCITLIGDYRVAVVAAASGAKAGTAWVWAGQKYAVWLRPLLPGEVSCALAS